jgi:hypothetical protein
MPRVRSSPGTLVWNGPGLPGPFSASCWKGALGWSRTLGPLYGFLLLWLPLEASPQSFPPTILFLDRFSDQSHLQRYRPSRAKSWSPMRTLQSEPCYKGWRSSTRTHRGSQPRPRRPMKAALLQSKCGPRLGSGRLSFSSSPARATKRRPHMRRPATACCTPFIFGHARKRQPAHLVAHQASRALRRHSYLRQGRPRPWPGS